jgi:hypothetical protein
MDQLDGMLPTMSLEDRGPGCGCPYDGQQSTGSQLEAVRLAYWKSFQSEEDTDLLLRAAEGPRQINTFACTHAKVSIYRLPG